MNDNQIKSTECFGTMESLEIYGYLKGFAKAIKEKEKKINPSFRRFNIIPKLRQLTGKRYINFEQKIQKMTEMELGDLNRFLQDIDYEIMSLKKKAKLRVF